MMSIKKSFDLLLVASSVFSLAAIASSQASDQKPVVAKKPKQKIEQTLNPNWVKSMKWRSIGPTSMGGRIVDLAVVESHPDIFFVASASGGVFKTTNNGTTFDAQFQQEGSISIGDVCIAPSNPEIVWIGTGENNARNSVSWGDGVYKSTNGGKTWKNMGLKETFQIGRMAIHPKNPDIVYVGALGRLWGPNKERGIFKTTDGGRTWQKVLYIDEKTGCIDLVINPKEPETLIAAMYERRRDPFDGGDPVVRFGKGSGLYKTTDGGRSWNKITKGLPTVKMGRIGLDYYRSNPDVVFALVESEMSGKMPKGAARPAYMGLQGDNENNTSKITGITSGGPAAKAGLKSDDIIKEIDGKTIKTFADIVAQIRAHKAKDKIKIKLERNGKPMEIDFTFGQRKGQRNRQNFGGRLGGQRENIQNQQGINGFETGGVFKSTDGGESWKRVNSLNPRPFYFSHLRVDPSDEKYIYIAGISMYRSSNGGKTFTADAGRGVHPDHHTIWIDPKNGQHIVMGCDGGLNVTYDRTKKWEFLNNIPIGQFYDVGVDKKMPYNVFGGLQDNGSWGGPSRLRGRQGSSFHDWYAIGGGDGFVCRVDPENSDLVYSESQYGNMSRLNLKTGERRSIRPRRERGKPAYRFNWKTPFLLSHHNSKIFYCAGNKVFKSLNRGDKLRAISPEITTEKQGTATALAESPLNADVLYVGTDDGNLWVTKNGGSKWDKLNITGMTGKARVNSIEPSRYAAGRCYVVLDGHYYNSDDPEVWLTEDFGNTWTSLRSNLPRGCTRVLREDIANKNLLYLGTEFGLWATVDRGKSWTRINNNLPHVAVHEIAIHPTAGEIVAATHGRSLWILDVTTLRQIDDKALNDRTTLFAPKNVIRWQSPLGKRYYGSKRFLGENPYAGAQISYLLNKEADEVNITVQDVRGDLVYRRQGRTGAGLQILNWNLLRRANTRTKRRRGQRGGFGSRSARVTPGTYLVTLDVDGKKFKQTISILRDPQYSTNALTYEEWEKLQQRENNEGGNEDY